MKIWEPRKKDKNLSEMPQSPTDPQGSWTGKPAEPYDIPVQDADDL